MLRIAAVAALVLGAGLVLAYLTVMDKGPFATPAGRHQRQMKDRATEPAAYEPVSFADLAALPRVQDVSVYAPVEQRGVSLECYVQRMFRAHDGDYHLDLAPAPGEATAPQRYYCAAEITPQWHAHSSTWRFEGLAAAFRPLWGAGAWDRPPRRVRLSGWLMYDPEHATPPDGAPYPTLLSQYEVHPVTRIEVWDDSLAAFAEIVR